MRSARCQELFLTSVPGTRETCEELGVAMHEELAVGSVGALLCAAGQRLPSAWADLFQNQCVSFLSVHLPSCS